jgi:uroporphyrinogen-III synthase
MAATTNHESLRGRTVVITRPAGTATAMAQQVRALGGVPLLLPGLALRAVADAAVARAELRVALADDLLIFTSPAAVRFAARLSSLQTTAAVLAVGEGTAKALRRHCIEAQTPSRQDSEGVLAHPLLRDVRGRRVALIGAPGGRGVLREQLALRHAVLRDVHVYRRVPPRLDRRHVDALLRLPSSALVLLSSAEALQNLTQQLSASALEALRAATAVVSSERLAMAAWAAGFTRIVQARSALTANLLDAAVRAD